MNKTKHLIRKYFARKQDKLSALPGFLGNDGGTVVVPNRPNYVYARIPGYPVAEVYNNRVAPLADLPVLIGTDPLQPAITQVLGVRAIARYGEDGETISPLQAHASTHRWMGDGPGGGSDVLWTELRQFLPWRLGPGGGLTVHVYRGVGYINGAWQQVAPASTIDLSSYVPTADDKARYVLITIDTSGAVTATAGTEVAQTDFGLDDIPAHPADTAYVLGAVRLYTGQTEIVEARTDTDIVDLRFPMWHTHEGYALDQHDHSGAGDGGVLTNDVHDGYSEYQQMSAPASPAAGALRMYARSQAGIAKLFCLLSTGTELEIGGGHMHVLQEDHSAICNGSRTQFIFNQGYVSGTTQVWLNGLLQDPAADYAEAGDSISILFTTPPIAGDSLIVAYIVYETSFTPSGPYTALAGTETAVATQLHCHTTESDGALSPADLVTMYAADGVGALAITDHDLVTAQPDGITSKLPGSECSTNNGHVLSLGCSYARGAETNIQNIINGIVAAGGYAVLAHPRWSNGFSLETIQALTGYTGVEIYNSIVLSGVGSVNPVTYPGFNLAGWDTLLTDTRKDIWGFASDDYHDQTSIRGHNRGRLQVFVGSNTPANLLAALAAGNFVANVCNDGVTPGIPSISPTGISLTCLGATKIRFIGSNGALLEEDTGESGAYAFTGSEGYVRMEAVGSMTEGFDASLDTANLWGVDSGSWSVSGGILRQTSDTTGPHVIFLKRHRHGDFEAIYKVRVNASAGTARPAGLLFNLLNLTNAYYLTVEPPQVSGDFVLWKYANSSSATEIARAAAVALSDDTWYSVRLQYTFATGGIKARVWDTSGAEPETWDIDTTDTTHKWGGFGFRCRYLADFDDLYIDGFKSYYQPISLG
jgi:hypothetical protein